MRRTTGVLTICAAMWFGFASNSQAEWRREQGEWRFPVRFTFLSSVYDIADWHEDNTGADVDVVIPVGLSFAPYYEFPFGLALWGGVGPVTVMFGDIDYWNVPLNMGVGYSFLPNASVSPYARLGVQVPLADGDFVEDTSPGAVAAIGVEFMRKKPVGIHVEVGYSDSTVTFGGGPHGEEIEGGFMLSAGAVF